MVIQNDIPHHLRKLYVLKVIKSGLRMLFHHLPLEFCEWSVFIQYMFGNFSFANIVKETAECKTPQNFGLAFSQGFGHGNRQNAHARRMEVRVHIVVDKILNVENGPRVVIQTVDDVIRHGVESSKKQVVHAGVEAHLHQVGADVLNL